ncbi:hypothetical protein SAMN04487895_101773 [Paenibacillus sophorae]|uniref:Uncharacterized protein n=1 Tax=Paenibacillus sophorae TaxID=1333845 RepID=A0A1H8H8Q1_9BACL|nr:hypothetical protein [Paenibacillus sophorae]QWU14463.1 hypothetical protein KP014_21380 [Paenibacillus sophorae]SEN51908.1 hypothetical protein SAMN04487895_101773 [Paenibacillus sophorae]
MEGFYTDAYGRVWGNKTVDETVVITSSNNEITISSAEDTYTFSVPTGIYKSMYVTSSSELVDAIHTTIQSNSYPIDVFLGGLHNDVKYNSIVFRLSDGTEITSISGTFFDNFFNSI